jgi:Tfp pilus assembly protein PilN
MQVAYAIGALVVLLVLAYVVMPLLLRRQTTTAATGETVLAPSLAEQRASIYRELTELELDQRVGKVAEADFAEQSEALLARAASLISLEDARNDTGQTDLDAQVEREIAEVRASLRPTADTAQEARP